MWNIIPNWIKKIIGRDQVGVWIPNKISIEATRTILEEKKLKDLAAKLIELNKRLARQRELVENITPEQEREIQGTQLRDMKKYLEEGVRKTEEEMKILIKNIQGHDQNSRRLIEQLIRKES
jgi:hypothetical protein